MQAQDTEPTPWNFVWGFITTPRTFDLDSFKQEKMFTGFQWGSSWQMNNALMNTGAELNNYVEASGTVNTPISLILQPKFLDSTGYNPGYFGSVMMQYEPTLPLDGTNEGTILREDDETDPIFGFRYRRGTISTTPSDPNYSRLVLKQSDKASYGGDKVLEDIWPQPYFDSNTPAGQTDNYPGKLWYLTINLKRLNPSSDTIKDNAVVMSIKLPYINMNNTTGNIKFDSIPSIRPNDTIRLDYFENRGIAQKIILNYPSIDSISITRNMLPITSDDYENITISASFITNGDERYNEIFSRNPANTFAMKEFDIEVNYFGNTDIAIDYIRVENVAAHYLVRGVVDTIARNGGYLKDSRGYIRVQQNPDDWFDTTDVNNIKDIVQTAIDGAKGDSHNWADAKLYRLKFQDTESSSYYWWGALRYCNKFANGIYMTADGVVNPRLYNYYTHSNQRLVSMRFYNNSEVPVPWMRIGIGDWTTMGIKRGYLNRGPLSSEPQFLDTLSSEYETKVIEFGSQNEWSDLKDDAFYQNNLIEGKVAQAKYENTLVDHFYKEPKNDFLYSGSNWIFQNILHNIKIQKISPTEEYLMFAYHRRGRTAEEFRLFNMGAIIRGAKGILVDGDENRRLSVTYEVNDKGDTIRKVVAGDMGVGDHDKLNDTTNIYSNLVGDDFINYKYNTWNAWNYSNLDTLSKYMQVDTDRVYIGTKSYRAELYEINSFMHWNNDLLMKLRLSATYSKGYRAHYSQDDVLYGGNNLLKKFIDIDTTKSYTSRLVKKSFGDINLVEPFDSAFFDITILRDPSASLDSIFYIGVQNRRVDPLIYYTNPSNPSQKYMRFLSSAEFRDSCMHSPDSLEYQSYWWKRIGARKITIPFDYTYSNPSDYKLLRISEVGSNNVAHNSEWHRGPKYYDMVTDTVIGQDRSISFDLLPGQAKILKVEVLKPGITAGYLDNYNQTNLIEYPDPIIPNMSVFHLVYFKKTKVPSDTTKRFTEVEYIRSFPIAQNSQEANIKWDYSSKKNISEDYLSKLIPLGPKPWNCNHPSIVVRNDSLGNQFAYIVYTCEEKNLVMGDSAKVISAKIDILTKGISSNKEIHTLSSNDIENFGTPVQNASANGNYIAWTDPADGLFIAYQKPSEDVPSAVDTIKIDEFPGIIHEPILFPSFNTYSHIANGENNAALVWGQKIDFQNGIYYSRIYYDPLLGIVTPTIPPNYVGGTSFPTDINNKFARVGRSLSETKPIVYRSLSSYNAYSPYYCIYNRIDNIDWIDSHPHPWFAPTLLNGVTLYHRDLYHVNDKWSASKERKLLLTGDITTKITSINSAQKDGIIANGDELNVAGDYNLDFTLDSTIIYQIPRFYGSNFLLSSGSGWVGSYPLTSPQEASTGSNVQLAKSQQPNYNNTSTMWKNRRVFQTGETDTIGNPFIRSSANLFYKTYPNQIINQTFFGFSGDSNNIFFDLPKFEGDLSPISSGAINFEPRYAPNPCTDFVIQNPSQFAFAATGLVLLDTDNDGDKEMEISLYGHKNSDVSVILERASDLMQVTLTMPTSTAYPMAATKLIYSILDSSGSTFNLIYQNNDTTATYNETSFLGGLDNNDTISYKSAMKYDPVKYIIDFNNGGVQYAANQSNDFDFKVYPNPTSGVVSIRTILPEEINGYRLKNRDVDVAIYDATGRQIFNRAGASGQTIDFDMTDISSGAYTVKVQYQDGNKSFKATEKLIRE